MSCRPDGTTTNLAAAYDSLGRTITRLLGRVLTTSQDVAQDV